MEGESTQATKGLAMKPPRSPSRPGRDRDHVHHPAGKGAGDAGAPFDPAALAVEEKSSKEDSQRPKAAPAPGVPVSTERYEQLKHRAKTVRTPPSRHAQEDPGRKGKG
jgi:hypothetical protein